MIRILLLIFIKQLDWKSSFIQEQRHILSCIFTSSLYYRNALLKEHFKENFTWKHKLSTFPILHHFNYFYLKLKCKETKNRWVRDCWANYKRETDWGVTVTRTRGHLGAKGRPGAIRRWPSEPCVFCICECVWARGKWNWMFSKFIPLLTAIKVQDVRKKIKLRI